MDIKRFKSWIKFLKKGKKTIISVWMECFIKGKTNEHFFLIINRNEKEGKNFLKTTVAYI